MAKYSNGNDLIKGMVILGDFIILNFIIAIFLTQFQDWVPPFFQRFRGPRLVFLTANLAMVINAHVRINRALVAYRFRHEVVDDGLYHSF